MTGENQRVKMWVNRIWMQVQLHYYTHSLICTTFIFQLKLFNFLNFFLIFIFSTSTVHCYCMRWIGVIMTTDKFPVEREQFNRGERESFTKILKRFLFSWLEFLHSVLAIPSLPILYGLTYFPTCFFFFFCWETLRSIYTYNNVLF